MNWRVSLSINTVYYVVGTVPIGIILSLLLAMAMNQNLRGIVGYRAIFFLPTITSAVAISLMWAWMYNPQFGVINTALKAIGMKGPKWLASPDWAMPAIMIMSVWRGLGYNMLLFLAGLQGIPKELLEAAEIRRRKRDQRFRLLHHVCRSLSPRPSCWWCFPSRRFQVFEDEAGRMTRAAARSTRR